MKDPRMVLAVALTVVGCALLIVGVALLVGPWALVAFGAVFAAAGLFGIDDRRA